MRFLIVTALVCGAAAQARAAEPWDSPFAGDPAAIARAGAKVAGPFDAGAVVLLDETLLRFDAAGRLERRHRMVYRLMRQAAIDDYNEWSETYAPWHEQKPALRARVISDDGVVRELDAATLEERPAASGEEAVYSDTRQVRAPLPGLAVGATIEAESVKQEHAPFFAAGRIAFAPLAIELPVVRARVVVEAPRASPLTWKLFHLDGLKPRRTEADGRVTLVFERVGIPAASPSEEGGPAETPYLLVASGRSWNAVASQYARLVDDALAGSDVAELARQARGDATDPGEIAARLLARVQAEVRYASVALGEGSIVPRRPAETLQRKYGDCKDKSTLLVALLRASGLPAHVALLRIDQVDDIDPALPSLAFNHAIVVVPGNPAIWIDPTDPFSRAGTLPVSDQGRRALIASADTKGLVETPRSPAVANGQIIVRTYRLAEDGAASVSEASRRTGALERDYRAYREQFPIESAGEDLRTYLNCQKVDVTASTPPRAVAERQDVRFEGVDCGNGSTDVHTATLAVYPAIALHLLPDYLKQKPADDETRRTPYTMATPFTMEAQIRAVPPPGYAAHDAPAGGRIEVGPWAILVEHSLEKDGAILSRFKLETDRRTFAPKELLALRRRVDELFQAEPTNLVFQNIAEEHMAAGRVREALEEGKRLLALHPDEALHAARLAGTLIEAGLGDAARDTARRGTELDPKSAWAWEMLGYARIHDALGRYLQPGWDPKGAETAYRKALALEPDYASAQISLAAILEHDDKGVRYSPRARLAEAEDLYRAVWRKHKHRDAGQNLFVLLMHREKPEEMRALARELEAAPDHPGMLVAAIAAKSGVTAAMTEVRTRARDAAGQAEVIRAALANLILLRRYDAAIALSPNLTGVDQQARAELAKLRRVEDAPASSPPLQLARKAVAAVVSGDRATLEGLLAFPDSLRDEWYLDMMLYGVRRSTLAMPLAASAVVDLAATSADYTVDGDERGWHIKAPRLVGTKERDLFVIKVGDKLRLGAYGDPAFLAPATLDALRRGRIEEARRYLEWMKYGTTRATPDAVAELGELDERSDRAALEAAAALTATGFDVQAALEPLARCATAATPEPRRRRCGLARGTALAMLGRPAEALKALEAALPAGSDAMNEHALRVVLLRELARDAEAERALADGRARFATAFDAAVVGMGYMRGRCEPVSSEPATQARDSFSFIYGHAMCRAIAGTVSDEDLARLRKEAEAAALEPGPHRVLAYALASRGDVAGARLEMDQLALDGVPLEDGQWLVLGRMSEDLGFHEAARRSYQRIRKPFFDHALSPYAVAQARLARLGR